MKPVAQADILRQVLAWRAVIVVTALLLGPLAAGLIGQTDHVGGYLLCDVLLAVAVRPAIAHLGPPARRLHLALTAWWVTGVFFLALLLWR